MSLRDYGTRLAHQFRRQIWVTAVDHDRAAEESEPPRVLVTGARSSFHPDDARMGGRANRGAGEP